MTNLTAAEERITAEIMSNWVHFKIHAKSTQQDVNKTTCLPQKFNQILLEVRGFKI